MDDLTRDELLVLDVLTEAVSLDEAQIGSRALLVPSYLKTALEGLVAKDYVITLEKGGQKRYVLNVETAPQVAMAR